MKRKGQLMANSIEKGRISVQQFFFLSITFVISTADIMLPNIVAEVAKEDAWISVIIATVASALTVWVASKLQIRMGHRNIIDMNDYLLGKIIGKVVSLLYIVLRELNEIMLNVFFSKTPIYAISITMMVIVSYGVAKGIEVFCRVNEILIPVGIVTLIFVLLFNIADIKLHNFLPIFYHGIMPSLIGAIFLYAWITQIVIVIFMSAPYLKVIDKRLTQASVGAVAVLGIMLMVGVSAIAIFGAERTAQLQFPALNMVRNIDIYDFIQRLDAFIFAIWVGGITIKLIALFFFIAVGLGQWSRIANYKVIIPPVAVLITFGSILWIKNEHTLFFLFQYAVLPIMVVTVLVIPLILTAVSYIKKSKPYNNTSQER